MNMSNATKYSARDSATSALRKIGIVKSDYDDFIVRRDGVFYCDIEGAKAFVTKTQVSAMKAATAAQTVEEKLESGEIKLNVAKERAKAEKAAEEKPAETKPEGTKNTGISGIIRALILEGKSNAEVWALLGPNGNKTLAENRKSYPAWFRCELRRNGHAV